MSVCMRTGCREGMDPEGKRGPAELSGSVRFCFACSSLVERHLRQLVTLYDDLEARIGGSQGSEPRVSGSRHAPVPIDLGMRALQEDLVVGLLEVEDDLREQRGYTRRVWQGSERQTLHTTVRFLTGNLDFLLERSAGGVDTANWVEDQWRRIRKTLGQAPEYVRLAEPCPDCDTAALVHERGTQKRLCRNCGSTAWLDDTTLRRFAERAS